MEFVVLILVFCAGGVAGLKLPFFALPVVLVASYFYLKSEYVRSKEIGAIMDLVMVIALNSGLVIGNIAFYIFYYNGEYHFIDALKWLITP